MKIMTNAGDKSIEQTKKWISDVVIGCNFCPFAARPFNNNSIHYQALTGVGLKEALQAFLTECIRLDENNDIETSFLIFPDAFMRFEEYLDLVSLSEKLLKQENYEGVYQVASFHPQYRFAGTKTDDAANYTNRSPKPMLHVLREARIEQALLHFTDPESIPERNVQFARNKGVQYMKMLWEACQ